MEEAVGADAPELPNEALERRQPRAALIAVAVLVIVGTVAMATRTGSGPSRAAAPAVQARRDVIIVAIDGLGTVDVSAAGTPFLAEFGAGSVLYRDAYAPSPWASEALSGLLTGQHRAAPRGAQGWIPGLADELLHRGYRAAFVPGHRRHLHDGAGRLPGTTEFDEVLLPTGLDDPAGAQGSSVVQAALRWLEESERPSLLVVTLADPRAPHHFYEGGAGGPDPRYDGPVQSGMAHDDLLRVGPSLNAADRAQLAALHATEVAAADAFARQLVEGARQHRDVAPVIAVAGLRRAALGEQGRYGLVPSMEPEDLRVPLWLEVPSRLEATGQGQHPAGGERPGARSLRGVVSAPASLLDLGPTLLSALGLAPRGDLDGESVFPGAGIPERPIRAATSRGICAVVGLDGDRAVILEAEPPAAIVRSRGNLGADQPREGRWGPVGNVTGVDADLRLQLARWMKRARIAAPGGGVPDLEAAPFTP